MSLIRQTIAKSLQFTTLSREWCEAQIMGGLLGFIRLFPVEPAMKIMERLALIVGPRTSRHQLALKNLEIAFPDKSYEEREQIAFEMWRNMSRLAGEYVFLDKLSNYDPEQPDDSNLEIIGTDIFINLKNHPRPYIVFTIHSGNFELLPIISEKFGLRVSALFRPPNNKFIAKKIFAARGAHMSDLVPSKAGAAWTLARKLENGGAVGMLVDQKFHKGADTLFFGHRVKTNPLLAKLVRQYDCDVFPARSIRLKNGRFRLELEPAIDIPRDEKGHVDIQSTSQMLNDKVETWVREYPGQWQWFHDRWNIKHTLKKR